MIVAITGATGFIGKEIINYATKHTDIQIIAISRKIPDDRDIDNCKWMETDYSINSLSNCLKGVDAIIHLAAIRGTQGKIMDYHQNENLLENILLAMNIVSTKHIILASSIAVYSNIEQIPWKEDYMLTPKTLYGITKASCEYLCQYYSKKFNIKYTILRIAQVLGLGESRKGMMNNFIDCAKKQRKLIVIGESIQKRQFIYVKDLAKIFCETVLQTEKNSAVFNVGMDLAYSNLEIATYINKIFKNKSGIEYQKELNENIESSCMCINKLKKQMGVVPLTMEEALTDIYNDLKE